MTKRWLATMYSYYVPALRIEVPRILLRKKFGVVAGPAGALPSARDCLTFIAKVRSAA